MLNSTQQSHQNPQSDPNFCDFLSQAFPSSESSSETGKTPGLGNHRDTPTKAGGKKKNRYLPNRMNIRLTSAARLASRYYIDTGNNLRGGSVSGCGRWNLHTKLDKGNATIKRQRDEAGRIRSSMEGHFQCKCSWTCEPCGAKQCEHVRSWLIQALYPALARIGLTGGLLTLTIRHEYGDDWRKTVEAMRAAYGMFDKNAKRIYQEFGVIGKFRAAEAPVGRNGLHFHYHVLLPHFHLWPVDDDKNEQHLVPREGDWWLVDNNWPKDKQKNELHLVPRQGDRWISAVDIARFKAKLEALWNDCVRQAGAFCNEHGFDFQPNRLDTYLAKVGLAHEVASQTTKTGRQKGRSLGRLLDLYSRGDTQAGDEWTRAIVALGGTSRFHGGSLPDRLRIQSYSQWEDKKKITKPLPMDDIALVSYPIDDHIKATHPIIKRPSLAMILRAARQAKPTAAVHSMVSALCAEYDRLRIPPWVMKPGGAAVPIDPDIPIMKAAKARPLSADEVQEYLRVKRGYAPSMVWDDFDVGTPMAADAECPF